MISRFTIHFCSEMKWLTAAAQPALEIKDELVTGERSLLEFPCKL